jgi:hypothetical protein
MRRFLKPGFHSGTVPKLYRKLRHAAWAHDSVATRKYRETILGIEEAVRHFAERELVYLLDLSRSWGKAVLSPGRVVLGCTNIRVELRCPQRGADSVWILFEEQAGLLSASIADAGWLERLEEVPARAFEAAVTGWYKLAAVERVCGYPAFSATPITWRRWLDTWQRDQRGEELPDLPKGLSDRPASHDGSLVRLRGHSDGP